MNVRAEQRIDELGLSGFPTTFFDGGYGQVLGGYADTSVYTDQIMYAGAREVSTDILDLTVEMNWLNGEGGPDDDIEITVTITINPGISFTYPEGVPELIDPGQETTFDVIVAGIGEGIPVPGTGQLHYSINDAAFITVDMEESVPNEYVATLPAVNCGDYIDFYLSAEEQALGILYDHEASPYNAIPLNVIDTVFSDDFEDDNGWTISGGLWARGQPTGGGGAYGNPDPTGGHWARNVIGYNLSGDYTNSMPQYHITSPAIDCSGLDNIELGFWRWLNVEQPAYDHAYIKLSNNGSSWTTIWENDEEITDNAWNEQILDISSYAADQATVYLRFTMGTTDGSWTFSGWNIDDLSVIGYACELAGLTISTSSLPDWTVNQPYSQTLDCVNQSGSVVWTDRDGNLSGTGLSLSAEGLVSGTPTGTGDISFIAQVIDEVPDTAVKAFTFAINPAVEITTTELGDGTEGAGYSVQLEHTGGTGAMTWTDLNGDLAGSGLTLSTSGLLSGTPASASATSFTAQVTDIAGAGDQQPLTVNVNPVVEILTTSMPDAVDGQAYAHQLLASGGTGTINWVDVGDTLSGTGLSLSNDGLVSGTPAGVQTVNFTVSATDDMGSTDQQELAIDVVTDYVCGDADASGSADIDDAVYLISHIFAGGPAPDPLESGDADCSGAIDIDDVVYLIAYIFSDGPAPCDPNGDSVPDC